MKSELFPVVPQIDSVSVLSYDHQVTNPIAKSLTNQPIIALLSRCLPMIDKNKIPDLVETSLICMLSAVVAILGFLLVWLIGMLAGFARA